MALWQTTQTPDDGYTNTHMAKGSTISLEELYKCVCTLSTAWITAMQQQCSVYCSCNMQYVPNSTSTNQIRISNVITLTKKPVVLHQDNQSTSYTSLGHGQRLSTERDQCIDSYYNPVQQCTHRWKFSQNKQQ